MKLLQKLSMSVLMTTIACLPIMADTVILPKNSTTVTDSIQFSYPIPIGTGITKIEESVKPIIPSYYEKDIKITALAQFKLGHAGVNEYHCDEYFSNDFEKSTTNDIVFHSVIVDNTVCVDLVLLINLISALKDTKITCRLEDKDLINGYETAIVEDYEQAEAYQYQPDTITYMIGTNKYFGHQMGDVDVDNLELSVAPFFYSYINGTGVNYVDGRFYVPMIDVVESFGGSVTYNSNTDSYKLNF